MIITMFNRRNVRSEKPRYEYNLCDEVSHWLVTENENGSVTCSFDGQCNERNCYSGKKVEDLNSLPKVVQEKVKIFIEMPGQNLLVVRDEYTGYKIYRAGDKVMPYQLVEGQLLKPGEVLKVTRLVHHSRYKIENIEEVVINENGIAIIRSAKDQFAREQYQLLRQYGFNHAVTYRIIGITGPSFATKAVEYAYVLFDALVLKLNSTNKQTICFQIDLLIKEVDSGKEINELKKLIQVLKLPIPEVDSAYSLEKILNGSKAVINFGLPQKIKKMAI